MKLLESNHSIERCRKGGSVSPFRTTVKETESGISHPPALKPSLRQGKLSARTPRQQSKISRRCLLRTLIAVGVLLLLSHAAWCQNYTWNNQTGNFSTSFTPQLTVGSASASLLFGGASYTATDNLTNAITLNAITFSNTGTVTLARGTNTSATNRLTFTANGSTNPTITLNNTGSLLVALDCVFNAATTIIGARSATFSGILSGTGSLTMDGSGTLNLTGANTYTGGTMVSNGTLAVGTSGGTGTTASLGTGNVTVNGGSSLAYYAASNAGSRTIGLFTGSISFNNTATAGGSTINNNNGGLSFNNSATAGNSTINNQLGLSFNNTATAGSSVITNTARSGSSIGVINFNDSATAGTARITNSNSYLGFNNLSTANSSSIHNSGRLEFNNSATASSSTISNSQVGVIDFNGTATAGNSAINNDGHIDFNDSATAGNAAITNSATLTFNNTSTAGSSTITNNGNGTLIFNGTATAASATIINNGALEVTGAGVTIGALSGSGIFRSGTLTVGGLNTNTTINGIFFPNSSLIKVGTGTLTLSDTDTDYAPSVTIREGKVSIGSENHAKNVTLDGGVLQWTGNSQAYGLRLSNRTISLGNASTSGIEITNATTEFTVLQVLSGSGSLTKTGSGTLILSGANTYTGRTTVSAGTLTLGNTLALQNSPLALNSGALTFGSLTSATLGGLSGTQNLALTNGSAAAVALTVGGNGTSNTYSGVLSGSGRLTKTGNGVLTLTGANTYTGGTTISSGTVVARGGTINTTTKTVTNGALGTGAVTVAAGATLSVGQAVNQAPTSRTGYGILALSSLTLTGGSAVPLLTFNLGLQGSTNGSTNDLLQFSGSANSLVFSGSGTFAIGFASQVGASIVGGPVYTLMTFATPIALTGATVSNPNSKFSAIGVGNMRNPQNPVFSWVVSGGNITGLAFTFTSAQVLPEPDTKGLIALIGIPALVTSLRRWKMFGYWWRIFFRPK